MEIPVTEIDTQDVTLTVDEITAKALALVQSIGLAKTEDAQKAIQAKARAYFKRAVLLHEQQWHVVTIAHSADEGKTRAQALMTEFENVLTFMRSGIPVDVEVYHHTRKDGSHAYYFSPLAAAIGKNVLSKFEGSPCVEKPDLDGAKKVVLYDPLF